MTIGSAVASVACDESPPAEDKPCEHTACPEGGAPAEGGSGNAAGRGVVARAGSPNRGGSASTPAGADGIGNAAGAESEACDPNDDAVPELDTLEPNEACADQSPAAWNIVRGGLATASDSGVTDVSLLFDQHSGTSWQSKEPTPWIAYELPGQSARAATSYRLTSSGAPLDKNAFGDPQGWQLQGSNDARCAENLEWTTLDSQVDQVFTSRYEVKTYSLDNTAEFHRYRLQITDNGGAPATRLAELELFGDGVPLFSLDDALVGTGEHQFQFSSHWTGHSFDNTSERFNGTTSWCNEPGQSVTVNFVGSQARVFGVTDPGHGIMGISVDDGPEAEVDLYGAAVTTFNRLVYTTANLCHGNHSIRMSVTGKKNTASSGIYASLDRLEIVP